MIKKILIINNNKINIQPIKSINLIHSSSKNQKGKTTFLQSMPFSFGFNNVF